MGIVPEDNKPCSVCGTIYPNTLAYFRPTGTGEPRSICRVCDRAADRQRWHGTREPLALIPGNAEQFYDHERELYNLTAMWRAAGCPKSKRPAAWMQTEQAKEFVAELNIANGYIKSDQGRTGGTWAHWQVAVEYAGYLSPAFAIQWNEYAAAYIRGEQRTDMVPYAAPPTDLVVRRLDTVESKLDQVIEWTSSVDKVQRTIRLRGGLYLARFRDEELSTPATLLVEYGIKDAAHWLNRGYLLVTIGKSSKDTSKRVAKHSGKLPVSFTKLEATFEIDDPDTGENYLRNNPPQYPIAYKVQARMLKDWFWLRRDVLEDIKGTWPRYITIADLTAHCKGWAFSTVVHAYAQAELFR